MTLYAGTIVDTPGDPFAGDPAEALAARTARCWSATASSAPGAARRAARQPSR